jgi:phenylacetate-CoA ligase
MLAGSRAFKTAGMNENDIVINCMNYCMWMGGFMDHQSMEATGAAVVPYGVGKTENLIAMLLDIDAPCIHSTPSYLATIRKVLQEKYGLSPRHLGMKKGFLGGEAGMQDESFRQKIESEWEMKAINANYGLSEVMSIIGSECGRREGLHFTAAPYLYVEIYEPVSKTVKPIEAGVTGELVLTNLVKEAQPLIRYRTGDIVEIISTDSCSCGNEGFRFLLRGRSDDMLVIKGINFIRNPYDHCLLNILNVPETMSSRFPTGCLSMRLGSRFRFQLQNTIMRPWPQELKRKSGIDCL